MRLASEWGSGEETVLMGDCRAKGLGRAMFCRREKERVREESADRRSLLAGEDVRTGGEDVVDRDE